MKIHNKYRSSTAVLVVILLALGLTFKSCEDASSDDVTTDVFIGGEIVNPNSNYVLFSRNSRIIDTIFLNDRNRFSYRLENAEQGLYLIKHRSETQNLYLEPGDSLLLRVNTLAFDESLHFSGKGRERNNFMVEMFLLDEDNAEMVLSYYRIPPAEFGRKTDSIKEQRLEFLEETAQKKEFSEDFKELAKKIIRYESYDLRERYTYLIQKYYKKYIKDLPQGFHDYREEVDFNDETIQSSPGYRRFIENYLINYSLQWCRQSGIDTQDCYDLTSHENILARIKKAAELITLPPLREHFLTKLGVIGIVMAKDKEDIQNVLDALKKTGFSEENMEDMRQLASIQVAYLPGTVLEEVPLMTMEGTEVSIGEISNQPTIIFLWSFYSRDHRQDHKLISSLRQKYPEIKFIGINVDVGETAEWRQVVRNHGYEPQFEYHLARSGINKQFYQYFLNKALFLDASGKVVIGDAFINSPEFESRILEFLNR